MTRPRIGVSSCLLGEEVRYNGGHSRCRFLTDELDPFVEWVPFCPEMEIGLGTPRETLRLTDASHLVNRSGTADHTAAMAALPLPARLDGYVFKAKSPSCGLYGIPRFSPAGQPVDRHGQGVYSARVQESFPLLACEEEGRLNDPVLRGAFTERVFAAARLRDLLSGEWRARDLAGFHARHKLQLLAHDPARCQAAGRVAAAAGAAVAAGGLPRDQAADDYRDLFLTAMTGKATRARNVNALEHGFSRVFRGLDRSRRADLADRIQAYRRGLDPLSVPVALLAHYAADGGLPWLSGQTYLAPFPAGLRLRHNL